MSLEAKSRMVSFRLSADEYERFRELCFSHGLQSVSDLARKAIGLLYQEPITVTDQSLELRVAGIEGRLKVLASDLKRLEKGFKPAEQADILIETDNLAAVTTAASGTNRSGDSPWQR